MPSWKKVIVSGSDAALGTLIITGSAVIGSGSFGPSENTLTLGARDTSNEGGQLGLNAPGGTYTSASFIDNWQNQVRILKGNNTTSTGEVSRWNLHNGQMGLAAYTSPSSFSGTVAGLLAFDSSGNIITTSPGGSGTVTSVSASGTVSGITLGGGTITTSGTLTLSGTISGLTTSNLSATAAITNAQLANSSVTVGSTAISLGSSATTIAGLSSVTSTSFVGALTGNATTATQTTNTVGAGSDADIVYSNMAGNDQFRIRTGGASNAGYVEIATADDGTEPIHVRQYTGVFTSLARTATLLDGSGNTTFPGTVTANGTLLTGNTGTVTSVGGTGTVNGITLTGTVNSSGNLTLGGTLSSIGNSQLTNSAITVGSTAISLGSSATTIAGLSSVTSTTFVGALTGNASTATTAATSSKVISQGSASGGTHYFLISAEDISSGPVAATVRTSNLTYNSATNTLPTTASWATNIVGGTGVTSVGGTGTVNGITLTGTVTSTGNLTLGGTLSGIGNSQLTNSTITIAGTSTALGSSISQATILASSGVFSGSAQIPNSSIANAQLANSTISGVALGSNLNSLTAGTYLIWSSGTTYNGSAASTLTVDAASSNTVSKVVVRDGSGNFAAGRITTSGLYGPSTMGGNNAIWQFDSGNTGYGIVYNEDTSDTLRIDVSGQALSGTPDFLVGDNYAQINGSTVWHAGNDGASSGLDADLLDGQHGTYYYAASNPSGYTTNTGTVTSVTGTGTVNGISLSGTFSTSGTLTLGGTLSGIGNSQLTNSSITVGSTAISLGSSATTIAGLSSVTSTNFIGTVTTSSLSLGVMGYPATSSNHRVALLRPSNNSTELYYHHNSFVYDSTTSTLSVVGSILTPSVTASLQGTASVASKVNTVRTQIEAAYYPTFVDSVNGGAGAPEQLYTVANANLLKFNPFAGVLTAGAFEGPLTGTASWATNVVNNGVTSVGGTGTVNGISLSGTVTSTGNLTLGGTLSGIGNAQLTNSSITVGSTAISLGATSTTLAGLTSVTSTNFVGTASLATSAQTVNTITSALDYEFFPTFVDADNGSATAETVYTDAGIRYNPSTNILTTTASLARSASAVLAASGPAGTYSIPWMSQKTAGIATYLQGDTILQYVTSTGQLNATTFNGAVTSTDARVNGLTQMTGSLRILQSTNTSGSGVRLRQQGTSNFWDMFVTASSGALVNGLQFRYNGGNNGGYLDALAAVANIDFTGQHRSLSNTINITGSVDLTGLIVVADGTYTNLNNNHLPQINEALPNVSLSTTINDKRVFGVISDKEEKGRRDYAMGSWVSTYDTSGSEAPRLIINSLGEGGMWVCNANGSLENGDYITTSNLPGFGMKQADDILHNYTVAKITEDCLFDSMRTIDFDFSGSAYKKQFVGVTYHCG